MRAEAQVVTFRAETAGLGTHQQRQRPAVSAAHDGQQPAAGGQGAGGGAGAVRCAARRPGGRSGGGH